MKKFIAPLIFGILGFAAIGSYLYIFVEAFKTTAVLVGYIVLVAALLVAMIVTLMRRYKEIKKGEEDDISKY